MAHDYQVRDPVSELIKTEKTYIDELTVLIETFKEPLSVWIKTIDISVKKNFTEYCLEETLSVERIDVIKSLFSNIDIILSYNRTLYADITNAREKGKREVAAVLERHAPYMRLYKEYLENYEKANNLLNRLMRSDSRFNAFITSAQLQKQCQGKNLQSFLILPVQRIPRYSLLLIEMMKTESDEVDKEYLKRANQKIVGINVTINTAIGAVEKRERLLEIQRLFGISDLTGPTNYVVKEGFLSKVNKMSKKSYFFVLTPSNFLYGEESTSLFKGKSYKLHKNFRVEELSLISLGDTTNFIIKSADKVFELDAGNTLDCNSWKMDISTILSLPRINKAPSADCHATEPFGVFHFDGQKIVALRYKFKDGLSCDKVIFDLSDLEIPFNDERQSFNAFRRKSKVERSQSKDEDDDERSSDLSDLPDSIHIDQSSHNSEERKDIMEMLSTDQDDDSVMERQSLRSVDSGIVVKSTKFTDELKNVLHQRKSLTIHMDYEEVPLKSLPKIESGHLRPPPLPNAKPPIGVSPTDNVRRNSYGDAQLVGSRSTFIKLPMPPPPSPSSNSDSNNSIGHSHNHSQTHSDDRPKPPTKRPPPLPANTLPFPKVE